MPPDGSWALHIAVLDDRDRCVVGPKDVIRRTDRDSERKRGVPAHRDLRLLRRAGMRHVR